MQEGQCTMKRSGLPGKALPIYAGKRMEDEIDGWQAEPCRCLPSA